MKYFAAALVYLGFFGLIGFACYYLHSAWPLFGLIAMPEFKFNVRTETVSEEAESKS